MSFAVVTIALYVGHHVGDYWVQTDYQALHKGMPGWTGRNACLNHVISYTLTQFVMLCVVGLVLDVWLSAEGLLAVLLVSGITHYLADRREHGLMFWLARKLGQGRMLELGRPRPYEIYARGDADQPRGPLPLDNPQLATGGWALDQSWHLFWGVFVAALLGVTL